MVHKLVGTPSSMEVKIPSVGWDSTNTLEGESPLGKKAGSFPMSLSKLAF